MSIPRFNENEKYSLLKKVSIVVVTRNRKGPFSRCIESLSRFGSGAELIVVDDDSRPRYAETTTWPGAKLIRNDVRKYLNPSRNIGAACATREYLLFIDDDNTVEQQTIPYLVKTLESFKDVGVAAPATLTPDGRIWYAGGRISPVSGLSFFNLRGLPKALLPEKLIETRLFHNCFMMKTDIFRRLGGFDEEHFPMYLAEADASERLHHLGLKVAVNPAAIVVHEMDGGGLRGLMRNIHITDPARAYFVGRNRILFMRLHRTAPQFLLFLLFFQPAISAIHILSIMSNKNKTQRSTNFVGPYVRGALDGISGQIRFGSKYARIPS